MKIVVNPKIIDCHLHFSNISSFKHCAQYESKVDYSYIGYIDECERNNVVASVCMGLFETGGEVFPALNAKTPMTADLAENLPDGMYLCPSINPHTLDTESLDELERLIKTAVVVGVKIYAGYYHFDVFDKVYEPVYKLCEKYGLPVAVHTGDTYSDKGLLEYSHPLKIDRLAVGHRDLKIVICHFGVPWIFDACEVAYKNKNVYIDLSGMLCGSRESIERLSGQRLQIERYRQAVGFLDNYKKLLFGTDWPLAAMDVYINFCKKLIPKSEWDDVFYFNALSVYNKIKRD